MIPILLAAAFLAMSAIDSGYNIYSTNKTTKASDRYNDYVGQFYGGKMAENTAYFDRYIRAHHLDPKDIKFPYRTGMIFDQSKLYQSKASMVSNEMARTGSYVHGATSVGRSAATGASLYNNYNKPRNYNTNYYILG